IPHPPETGAEGPWSACPADAAPAFAAPGLDAAAGLVVQTRARLAGPLVPFERVPGVGAACRVPAADQRLVVPFRTPDPGPAPPTVTDPFGRRTSFTYGSPGGRATRVQDVAGRITSLTVDANSDLVRVTAPDLGRTTLLYQTGHLLKVWVSPAGDRT